MTLNVAVVGTGFGTRVQIPALQLHPEVHVLAIVSSRLERAKSVAGRFHIPHAFDRIEDLLELEQLHAVSIATPPYLHQPMAAAVIRAGKHLLCEKPMALCVDEAREMLLLARRSKLVCAIDHEFRYTPSRATLKKWVDEGRLGTVRTVRLTHYRNHLNDPDHPWGWLSDATRGGGLLGAMGSHLIDMILYTFGPVRKVGAFLQASIPRRSVPGEGIAREVTADDTFSLMLLLESGTQVVMQVTSTVAVSRHLEVEVHGEHCGLLMEGNKSLSILEKGEKRVLPIPMEVQQQLAVAGIEPSPEQEPLMPFLSLVDDWVRAIHGAKPVGLPDFEDGMKVQEVMDAARESFRSGRLISIP